MAALPQTAIEKRGPLPVTVLQAPRPTPPVVSVNEFQVCGAAAGSSLVQASGALASIGSARCPGRVMTHDTSVPTRLPASIGKCERWAEHLAAKVLSVSCWCTLIVLWQGLDLRGPPRSQLGIAPIEPRRFVQHCVLPSKQVAGFRLGHPKLELGVSGQQHRTQHGVSFFLVGVARDSERSQPVVFVS